MARLILRECEGDSMKAIICVAAFFAGTAAVFAQVNTVITDGTAPFAEGILKDYVVQANGADICATPYVIGRYVSCRNQVTAGGETWVVPSKQRVWVETNGTLGGMIVVDENGRDICSDPQVWNQFRGPLSYIICGN